MRKLFIFLLLLLISVVFMSTNAAAYPVPADGEDYEMDIVGYSGLFREGTMLDPGDTPAIGDESRAILRLSNIHSMYQDWGGIKGENVFTSSNDTENLFVIEQGLFVDNIYNHGDGRVSIFFNNDDQHDGYEFEAYLDSDIVWPNDVAVSDPQWNDQYSAVAANDLLWAGGFTQSTYEGEWGTYDALVGITLDAGLETGRWIDNNENLSSPAGGSMNPQAWLGLDPDYAYPWVQDFWGPGKTLAIGSLSLDSSGPAGWTTYADDWTRGSTVPEPTTLLLFGTGLLGLAAFGRKRLTKQK